MTDEELARKFSALPKEAQAELLGNVLGQCLLVEYESFRLARHGMAGLGQATEDVLSRRATELLAPLIPQLQKTLVDIAEPAAKKAADVVGPVIRQELSAKMPAFAAITGLVLAAAVVAGIWLGRKVF